MCESGVCTAQRSQLVFHGGLKLSLKTPKKLPNTTQKHPQRPCECKKRSMTTRGFKKPNFGSRSFHSAPQKRCKLEPKRHQEGSKIKELSGIPEKITLGCALELAEDGFEKQNKTFLHTFGSAYGIDCPSLIFKGCTVRFACFCNRRSPVFTTRNSQRVVFVTCPENTVLEGTKRGQKASQKVLRNRPMAPSAST